MFCTNCGTKNADGAKFCTGCGAPLMPSASVSSNQQRQAPVPQPVQRAQAAPIIEERPPSRPAPPASEQPKRKKWKARVIIPIVAAVVVIAAVAVAAVFTNGFGLLGPVGTPVKETVNDYSWEELSKISAQISACGSQEEALEIAKSYNLTNPDGTLDGTQVKQIELTDGTTTEVQILGFYHDDKSDGSGKAGISFIFKDAVDQHAMNSSGTTEGGWANSEMRAWMNNELIFLLPEDLQSQITAVNKLTNSVGFTADPSSVTTTSDKLWLLSQIEIVGPSDGRNPAYVGALDTEGSPDQLFLNNNIFRGNPSPLLQKKSSSSTGVSPIWWWQRSSAADFATNFFCTTDAGEGFLAAEANAQLYVAPGFCI